MTNELIPFQFKDTTIRILNKVGEPCFCVPDIRKILTIPQNSRMIQGLKDGLAKSELTDSLGRKQETYFCSEKDLYKITLRSNSPEAEPFVDWVCGEVLPSIRKTGSYKSSQPKRPYHINMVQDFLNEHQIQAPKYHREPCEITYDHFLSWCMLSEIEPISANSFGRGLSSFGIGKARTLKGDKAYLGIKTSDPLGLNPYYNQVEQTFSEWLRLEQISA